MRDFKLFLEPPTIYIKTNIKTNEVKEGGLKGRPINKERRTAKTRYKGIKVCPTRFITTVAQSLPIATFNPPPRLF